MRLYEYINVNFHARILVSLSQPNRRSKKIIVKKKKKNFPPKKTEDTNAHTHKILFPKHTVIFYGKKKSIFTLNKKGATN